jgi:hypothetical protein
MASFWGIEMCEGLESPLSLFMDIRNWGRAMSVTEGRRRKARSEGRGMTTHLDHGCGVWRGPVATLEPRNSRETGWIRKRKRKRRCEEKG